ncbi:hypothetical protein [Aquimarina sp. 2201CG5-10]|uniref:hypothetical protein n=1 Tax=Aquimarina callyspongiae TaxID=3098150 RepID=UPI002AB488BC|nr:hypothetical protein [Aquimarina sp. 2201CG5-10]MDY8138475.1 hypothetical protein [Aquimarina sp. 2201CG5-10]
MQKKKLNKVLIAAVALIWGVVIYKFAAPYFMSEETVITADVLVKPPETFLRKKDTFNLIIPERDPFLGKTIRVKKAVAAVTSKKQRIQRPKSTTIKDWPKIEYLGFVKSKESKSKLGLLRVNGRLKRVRNGARIGDLKIKKIKDTQVIIQFQNETKDFYKVN